MIHVHAHQYSRRVFVIYSKDVSYSIHFCIPSLLHLCCKALQLVSSLWVSFHYTLSSTRAHAKRACNNNCGFWFQCRPWKTRELARMIVGLYFKVETNKQEHKQTNKQANNTIVLRASRRPRGRCSLLFSKCWYYQWHFPEECNSSSGFPLEFPAALSNGLGTLFCPDWLSNDLTFCKTAYYQHVILS